MATKLILSTILVTIVTVSQSTDSPCLVQSPYIRDMTISDAQAQFDDVKNDLSKLAAKLDLPGIVDVSSGTSHPPDCSLVTEGSGVYMIRPSECIKSFRVYCDARTDGGRPWTVIQRRIDSSVNFHRGWADYTRGFGSRFTEYWIGNENLYWLTAQDQYELRVELVDFLGDRRVAVYHHFRVGDRATRYQLQVGNYDDQHSDAGDALSYHNRAPFSTPDYDNDREESGNCAAHFRSGWWFADCYHANLNGVYRSDGEELNARGIVWSEWRGLNVSLKATEMKIRRTSVTTF